MRRMPLLVLVLLVALAAWLGLAGPATAVKRPDIANTKHNLSTTGPNAAARATGGLSAGDTTGSQICIFCHTPHGAENQPGAPLWNRTLSNASYTTYESKSMEAYLGQLAGGPMGLSKLCLSCHDGTLALGSVNVANGKTLLPGQKFPMTSDRMPVGQGVDTGFTRNLGTDLSNDHPISFTFNSTVAGNDGELRSPPVVSSLPPPPGGKAPVVVGTRVAGDPKPLLPLEDGKVQCTTCHDPHLREDDGNEPVAKFLRLNRLQKRQPGSTFSETDDIFCIACHDKGGLLWSLSAHANELVAVQTFSSDPAKGNPNPAALREFPANTPVWKAGCLSCHDAHTVKGSRRLLREGVGNADGTSPSPLLPRSGAAAVPAIEETCYQCHSPFAQSILNIPDNALVPDIRSDFKLSYRMPITVKEQRGGSVEAHEIGTGAGAQRGKDFVEDAAILGTNRHVECTDCHNPHRVIKNKKFNDSADAPVKEKHGGTHTHVDGVMHTNIASGVLKGTVGVEPSWSSPTFGTNATFGATAYKRGVGTSETPGSDHVTREYQVCLKCHSSYAYGTTPPTLGWQDGGGTASPRTGFDRYTDQAMEFQPHPDHKKNASQTNSGAFNGTRVRRGCTAPDNATTCPTGCTCATTTLPNAQNELNFTNNNHRSWHPVIDNTGRDLTARNISTGSWRAPWNGFIGSQTMYCTDCHGSSTGDATVEPTGNNPWGPHGSGNRFLLKGEWGANTGASGRENAYTGNALCFKCHNPLNYADRRGDQGRVTAYYQPNGKGNLHVFHTDRIGYLKCSWCHIAVPHGWKNRSFLVNLNDVGPEVPGMTAGTEVSITSSASSYTQGPYYNNAKLKIRSFATPGNWQPANCGSATSQGGTGQSWMKSVCETPP